MMNMTRILIILNLLMSSPGFAALELSGSFMLDQLVVIKNQTDGTHKFYNGPRLKDASVDFKADLTPSTNFFFGIDLSASAASLSLAFIDIALNETTSLKIGQVPSPFCLENSNSSKWLSFMERSLASVAFKPCLGPGLNLSTYTSLWSLKTMLRQTHYASDVKEDDPWGASVRGSLSPINTDSQTLHLGSSFNIQLGEKVTYKTIPEISGRNKVILATTDSKSPKGDTLTIQSPSHREASLELGYRLDSILLEAEYMRAFVERKDDPSLSFGGYHIQAAYILSGQQRSYNSANARFDRPHAGEGDVFEVAARFSHINLEDKDISGGKHTNYTLAFNWYPEDNIKVMANYVRVHAEKNKSETYDLLGLRLQTSF